MLAIYFFRTHTHTTQCYKSPNASDLFLQIQFHTHLQAHLVIFLEFIFQHSFIGIKLQQHRYWHITLSWVFQPDILLAQQISIFYFQQLCSSYSNIISLGSSPRRYNIFCAQMECSDKLYTLPKVGGSDTSLFITLNL